jgi:hypothetical protein
MFTPINPQEKWSRIGLRVLIASIIAAVLIALADGILKGPISARLFGDYHTTYGTPDTATFVMFATWLTDFRYLAEQAVYAATIFFVGAKFFETRSIFTIGFDRLDTAKIALKGPDDDNIVWIGQRYGTRLEAETVAAAFAERLKESAAA